MAFILDVALRMGPVVGVGALWPASFFSLAWLVGMVSRAEYGIRNSLRTDTSLLAIRHLLAAFSCSCPSLTLVSRCSIRTQGTFMIYRSRGFERNAAKSESVEMDAVVASALASANRKKENHMLYTGIDLHKESLTIACLDEKGTVLWIKTLSTKCINKIRDIFSSLDHPYAVAIEAVGFYHWLWDLLADAPAEKVLADPREVRARKAIKRAKTDRKDAVLLAELLRRGELPSVYVPTPEERALREICRHRHSLSRNLASCKNRFRRIHLKQNLRGPKSLDTASGYKFYRANRDRFADNQKLMMEDLLSQMTFLENSLSHNHDRMRAMLQFPYFKAKFDLYTSMPGISMISAATIIAETGDITRFDHAKEIAAYAGLDPRVSQSSETCILGAVSKAGPRDLRWILQQAAWTAIRCDARCKRIYERIKKRRGTRKAATAVARRIIIWIWRMTVTGEMYNPDYGTAA